MKKSILLMGFILAMGVVPLGLISVHYLYTDNQTFSFLASDPTMAEMEAKLGRPDEVYPRGADLPQKGWPLPKHPRAFELWIYSSKTGRCFFVYLDRANNRVEYVFSSSS